MMLRFCRALMPLIPAAADAFVVYAAAFYFAAYPRAARMRSAIYLR